MQRISGVNASVRDGSMERDLRKATTRTMRTISSKAAKYRGPGRREWFRGEALINEGDFELTREEGFFENIHNPFRMRCSACGKYCRKRVSRDLSYSESACCHVMMRRAEKEMKETEEANTV